MSEIASSSFAYPWLRSGKIKYPPGLLQTVGPGWKRLRLVGDKGVDIPPATEVETNLGWLLPSEMAGLDNVLVRVKMPSTRFSVNLAVVTQENVAMLKLIEVYDVPEGETRVDQLGHPDFGGSNPEPGGGVQTRPEVADVYPGVLATTSFDTEPDQMPPLVGIGWAPEVVPTASPVPGNGGVYTQQFSAAEAEQLRLILAGGGGGSGGVNATISYTNIGLLTWLPGMPVFSPVANQADASQGNIARRGVIGMYAGPDPLLPGAAGLVQVEGEVLLTASAWQLVTGEVGGLVQGAKYFLNFTNPGQLSRVPDVTTAPPGSYLVAVGYALNATTFKIEIQPGIRVS